MPTCIRHIVGHLPIALIGMMFLSRSAGAKPIHVSAAASLRESITEIGKLYEHKTGDAVAFTFGASGQLAAQIGNGAPVDAFISAAEKQVDDLAKAGLVDAADQTVIARNQLVLIVPADSKANIDSFEKLAIENIRRIAVGEPKTVPAGDYAMQVLRKLNLADTLAPRLVFGANVRQVLNYVEHGEVDAGIVYATDAKISGPAVKVATVAPAHSHEPIVYPAVVLKNAAVHESAEKFVAFLLTDEAQTVFARFGFDRPEITQGK